MISDYAANITRSFQYALSEGFYLPCNYAMTFNLPKEVDDGKKPQPINPNCAFTKPQELALTIENSCEVGKICKTTG
jgi:hypothetical protein